MQPFQHREDKAPHFLHLNRSCSAICNQAPHQKDSFHEVIPTSSKPLKLSQLPVIKERTGSCSHECSASQGYIDIHTGLECVSGGAGHLLHSRVANLSSLNSQPYIKAFCYKLCSLHHIQTESMCSWTEMPFIKYSMWVELQYPLCCKCKYECLIYLNV